MGARERARAEITAAILATASRHVAAEGAASLSLRAVARDLGMVSSALYRYFASRDELLTALIVEAYDDLGESVELAVARSRRRQPLERWIAAATAIRQWALDRPHDYTLVYGSPVPGYAAPVDTITPGTRATRAMISIVRDAASTRPLEPQIDQRTAVGAPTAAAFDNLRRELDLDVDDLVVLAMLLAWTQLFGLLGFELFGQTKGIVDDHGAFFVECARAMGASVGL
jgi:AcrR family transcriptional regulator